MKALTLLASGLACCVVACGNGQPPESSDMPVATNTAGSEPSAGEKAITGNAARISHMHKHAEQLELLNDALAVSDLDAAQSPAYWLSRHAGSSNIQSSWQPHLTRMRDAASAVELAPDVATARAAAQRIADSCNSCHLTAGVDNVI